MSKRFKNIPTESVLTLLDRFLAVKADGETDVVFSFETIKDLISLYFQKKNDNSITSENTLEITDITTNLLAVFDPQTITYISNGVDKSIEATPLYLDPLPETLSRIDAIFIDTNQDPNILDFKTGEESETPAPPNLIPGEIEITYPLITPQGTEINGVIYLSTSGNDLNSGKSIEKAVKTLTKAFELLVTYNYRVIKCFDNGYYTISSFPSRTNNTFLDMPNATISGTSLEMSGFYIVNCYYIDNLTMLTSLSPSYLRVNRIKNFTCQSAGGTILTGNTIIVNSLTLTSVAKLYCDTIRSYNEPTIASGATINGMINGTVYPAQTVDHNINTSGKQGGDGTNFYHTGKEIDTSGANKGAGLFFDGNKFISDFPYFLNWSFNELDQSIKNTDFSDNIRDANISNFTTGTSSNPSHPYINGGYVKHIYTPGDYIESFNNLLFNNSGYLKFSFWLYSPNIGTSQNQTFVSKGSNSNVAIPYILIDSNGNTNSLRFNYTDGTAHRTDVVATNIFAGCKNIWTKIDIEIDYVLNKVLFYKNNVLFAIITAAYTMLPDNTLTKLKFLTWYQNGYASEFNVITTKIE